MQQDYDLVYRSTIHVKELLDCARHSFRIEQYSESIKYLDELRFQLGLRSQGRNHQCPLRVKTFGQNHELMKNYVVLFEELKIKLLNKCETITVDDRCAFISWVITWVESPNVQSDVWGQLVKNLDVGEIGEILVKPELSKLPMLEKNKSELIIQFLKNSQLSDAGYIWALNKIVEGELPIKELTDIEPLGDDVMKMLSFCNYISHYKNIPPFHSKMMLQWLWSIGDKYASDVEILLDAKRENGTYLYEPTVNQKLFEWCFNQPILVQDFMISQLLATCQTNIGTLFELFDYEYIELPKNTGPFTKSLCWLYSILENLSMDPDKNKQVYYYHNTIGVITKFGLWQVEVKEDTWLNERPTIDVTFSNNQMIGKSICIHQDELLRVSVPVGDEIALRVLSCWNDEVASEKISTFATAMVIEE